MKMSSSRAVYLQGLRLLWSSGPVDQALARGQISAEEHGSILEAIARKQQARENLRTQWVVKDVGGHDVAEISRRRDGTFTVRALFDAESQPVVMTSEERYLENFYLRTFDAKRLSSGEFEIKIPYGRDKDLDNAVNELLNDIAHDAEDRHCFYESNAHMEGTNRHW